MKHVIKKMPRITKPTTQQQKEDLLTFGSGAISLIAPQETDSPSEIAGNGKKLRGPLDEKSTLVGKGFAQIIRRCFCSVQFFCFAPPSCSLSGLNVMKPDAFWCVYRGADGDKLHFSNNHLLCVQIGKSLPV